MNSGQRMRLFGLGVNALGDVISGIPRNFSCCMTRRAVSAMREDLSVDDGHPRSPNIPVRYSPSSLA